MYFELEKSKKYFQKEKFTADILALTYLHCRFGHPCQGYEDFLLHVKARTKHTDKGEEQSNQQSNEQRRYTQT